MTFYYYYNPKQFGHDVAYPDTGADVYQPKRFTGHPVLWEQTASQINEVITEINGAMEEDVALFADESAAKEIIEARLTELTLEFKQAEQEAEILKLNQVLTDLINLKKLMMEMADEEAFLLILANLD